MMKKVEAVVRTGAVKKIIEGLIAIETQGVTVFEVEGHGRQLGVKEHYREKEHFSLINKKKIEVVCEDKAVDKVVQTIMEATRTGEYGDGKIFVVPVHEVYRIRTGEKGAKAIQ
jgi:nitrogen regulatory protein P-II 1